MKKLTGEIRFRTNWRGKLILQVEESTNRSEWDGGGVARWTDRRWRDADVEDVSRKLLVQKFVAC